MRLRIIVIALVAAEVLLACTIRATAGIVRQFATVSLADYVCSNPLHDENEKHERMFLYALTWVDVGFNMKISVAVFLNAMSPGDSLFLRLRD